MIRATPIEVLRPYPVLDNTVVKNSLVSLKLVEEGGPIQRELQFSQLRSGSVGFRGQQNTVGAISFGFDLDIAQEQDNFAASIGEFDLILEASLIFISKETRSTIPSELFVLKSGLNRIELSVDSQFIGRSFSIRTVIVSRGRFNEDIPRLGNYVLYEDSLDFVTGGQKDSLNIRQVAFERSGHEKDFWKVIVDLPESFEELEVYSISRALAIEVNSNILGPGDMTPSLRVLLLSDIASALVDKLMERCVDELFFSKFTELMKRTRRGVPYFREKSLLFFIHLLVSELFVIELGTDRQLSESSFMDRWANDRQAKLGIWRSKWATTLKLTRTESIESE
jgi:hypothetical protein